MAFFIIVFLNIRFFASFLLKIMKYNLWYISYVKYCMKISYKLWHNNFKIIEWFTEWIHLIWIQMIGQLIFNYRHYYYIRLRVTCFIYFNSLYDINYIIIFQSLSQNRTLNQQALWMIFQNRVEWYFRTLFWVDKGFLMCAVSTWWSVIDRSCSMDVWH